MLVGSSESLLTTLAEFVLEQDGIAGVAFVNCISEIADEGNEADDEVDS